MNHPPGAVTPVNPEMVQVGDAVGHRAERRGLFQGAVRPVGVVCDAMSHVVSELVKEVWLMPET